MTSVMSKIEELDDLEENKIGVVPPAPSKPPPSGTPATQNDFHAPIHSQPDLPPHLSNVHSQSVDEVVADLKKTPFFMTSLDDAADDEDNPALDAIRALLYEGTRLEVATNFKEQGNEHAQSKTWRDAKELYGKGLAALKAERKPEDPRGSDEDAREQDTKVLLLLNRAQAHLTLQNYRSCSLDCLTVLELAPGSVKAYYRLASALTALSRHSQALAAADAGLRVHAASSASTNTSATSMTPTNTSNVALLALRARIYQKKEAADKLDQQRRQRFEHERNIRATLRAALDARQIVSRQTSDIPDLPDDAAIHLSPDPLSPTSTLVLPVLVLYPLHAQTDLIKAFEETQTLAAHLDYLLPLPWDEKLEYTAKGTEAYCETKEGGLVKWGRNVELLKLLSGGKVEVIDGIARVSLVPRNRAGEWIEEVRKRKKIF